MPNRNPGFEGNPCHDLCTEVAMMEHGHLPFTGGSPTCQPDDFEEPDLYADGDRNFECYDRAYVHGGAHDSSLVFESDEDRAQNYLLEMLAEEQAIEAAAVREEQLSEMYYRSECVPFFVYQHKRGTNQHAVQTRSEALAVSIGRSVKKGEAIDRKHQQFYGNLRIH